MKLPTYFSMSPSRVIVDSITPTSSCAVDASRVMPRCSCAASVMALTYNGRLALTDLNAPLPSMLSSGLCRSAAIRLRSWSSDAFKAPSESIIAMSEACGVALIADSER